MDTSVIKEGLVLKGSTLEEKAQHLALKMCSASAYELSLLRASGYFQVLDLRSDSNEGVTRKALSAGTKGCVFLQPFVDAVEEIEAGYFEEAVETLQDAFQQINVLSPIVLKGGFNHFIRTWYYPMQNESGGSDCKEAYFKAVKSIPSSCKQLLYSLRKFMELMDTCGLYPDSEGDSMTVLELDTLVSGGKEECRCNIAYNDVITYAVEPQNDYSAHRVAGELYSNVDDCVANWFDDIEIERLEANESKVRATLKEIATLIPSVIDETLSSNPFGRKIHAITLMTRGLFNQSCDGGNLYLGVDCAWNNSYDRDRLIEDEVSAVYLLF